MRPVSISQKPRDFLSRGCSRIPASCGGNKERTAALFDLGPIRPPNRVARLCRQAAARAPSDRARVVRKQEAQRELLALSRVAPRLERPLEVNGARCGVACRIEDVLTHAGTDVGATHGVARLRLVGQARAAWADVQT